MERGRKDHHKRRPEPMFNFKLVPLLSSEKPCLIEKGLKEGTTVLRRQIVEDTPKKTLGRMSGVLEKTAHSSNTGKNFLI
jgi:hypothetical protein